MTTTLIIARHGNTFESGETPRRVGARTDLPLTETGREQARAIGRYLRAHDLIPDVAYSSTLRRTIDTADLAVRESGLKQPIFPLAIFDEVDYGPDEDKTEDDVIARIGPDAIKNWDEHGIVPDGWRVDPAQIIENWIGFGRQIIEYGDGEKVLAVTSNGIARFAPYMTGDFDGFRKNHKLKIATGALCIMEHNGTQWCVRDWNIKP
ncbi:MAG: histidine phosphatase family protein [Alphaproteobacteria bacterium]|nr:histidine phosphatase family protein [Alphaproteobacteria bacterium]MBU0859782.1 histidine phosphatase family protein [Alphaproteobacteria bacterium]